MILITESKRDNLLMPYFEKVKDIYPDVTLGKFKEMMLNKLGAQGSLNNLSLSSNFYLAGATRYYFEGQLTTDGQAHLLSGNPSEPDNWNIEVCRRLNACINVLRNAYIDSVGTQFEQPEDFGTLSLPKLLRKYGKKIDAELGIDKKPKEVVQDTLDRNPRVGNGYTFDILYSYSDAQKYNRYTTPGAWCITYGQGHYDYYMRALGIHYVIFRKDGFENVPRQHDENFTPNKPHDAYGNSLIAFLQGDGDPLGRYITSRWNHGYEERIEADHAYTNEEFMAITGVSEEDLKRIYKIWKTDVKKSLPKDTTRSELKNIAGPIVRKLKYMQMLINGGESPERAAELSELEIIETSVILGNGKPKKSVLTYEFRSDADHDVKILVDRNKFLFETLCLTSDENRDIIDVNKYYEGLNLTGLIIIGRPDNYMLYNVRFHEFVNIGGVTKFKRLPKRRDLTGSQSPLFIEVKNGMMDIALLSTSTWRPVKLPNGEYWFNIIVCCDRQNWESRNEIHCHGIVPSNGPICEIIYDESSQEKYFFNILNGRFVDWINNMRTTERADYDHGDIPLERYKPCLANYSNVNGFPDLVCITFGFKPGSRWSGYCTKPKIYTIDGRPFSIYGHTDMENFTSYGGRFLAFMLSSGEHSRNGYYNPERYFYDHKEKRLLAIGDKPLKTNNGIKSADGWSFISGCKYAYIDVDNREFRSNNGRKYTRIIDMETGLFLENTTPYGKQKGCVSEFAVQERYAGDDENEGLVNLWNDDFQTWGLWTTLSQYTDEQLIKKYGTNDKWEIEANEERKHYSTYNLNQFEKIPNDLPINNETETNPEARRVVSLRESEIKSIVSESIKKVLK